MFDIFTLTVQDTSEKYGEQRFNLLGWLNGAVVHMTYTDDDETVRIISLREATKHEAKRYFQEATR